MYRDNESIRQFERQHARDMLIQQARDLGGDADTDLVTGHLAAERTQDKLFVVRSIVVAAVVVGMVLYIVASF